MAPVSASYDRRPSGHPSWRGCCPVARRRTPADDEARTGASSRLRLFQAVLALLGRMGAAHPVVHVVEDVHWADPSTLDLLAFLATNLTDERVLVLLTHRDDTVDESHTLDTWLAELGRMSTLRIEVPRLDEADVGRLVARPRGGAVTRALPGDARALGRQPAVRRAAAAGR